MGPRHSNPGNVLTVMQSLTRIFASLSSVIIVTEMSPKRQFGAAREDVFRGLG